MSATTGGLLLFLLGLGLGLYCGYIGGLSARRKAKRR